MRAATGGSLAAFLMIAPLVAIPVFAVVGIPQVAPAVSSGTPEDEPIFSSSTPAKGADFETSKSPADDLFASSHSKVGTRSKPGVGSSSRVVALSPESGFESVHSEPPLPVSARPSSDKRRARSTQDIDEALRSTDLAEWIPPAEALEGWTVAPESGVRGRSRASATDSTTSDLPAVTSRPGKIQPIAPMSFEEPAETTVLESEPKTPTPRRARTAVPRKKKPGVSSSPAMNFASVMEATTPSATASARPTGVRSNSAPRKIDSLAGAKPAAVVQTNSSSEKIPLTEFTRGLVHPADAGDLSTSGKLSLDDIPEPAPSKLGASLERSARKPNLPESLPVENEDPPTWEAATQRLKELGIRTTKLENLTREGQFLFSCSFTPGKNPMISRRFEAVAAKPLLAVQDVLRQINEWQEQH